MAAAILGGTTIGRPGAVAAGRDRALEIPNGGGARRITAGVARTAGRLDRDRAARRDQGQDQGHGGSGGRGGGDRCGAGAPPAPVITLPAGTRVWLAAGHSDMRKGFDGLALQVQEILRLDPHGGHLFVFRGRRGGLIKVLWHDGQGMCNPCSPNLCEEGRIGGCRQCRRAVGAGALDGDVPWKPATWTRRSQPGPRSPRPVGAGWPS